MRPQAEIDLALRLVRWGMNDCEIGRLTGIPRGTIRDWRHHGGRPSAITGARPIDCPICGDTARLERHRYAYLLGLYLGDGALAQHPRMVFKLRIVLDAKYPGIINKCKDSIRGVVEQRAAKVGQVRKIGCFEITAYWKHWPCLFPQHGPGPKHLRRIALEPWQQAIVNVRPRLLLRGLIHSDGSRDINWVKGKSYPRYQFTNNSGDIRGIFTDTCDVLGIHWTQPYWKTISISRRPDVTNLDSFIGPKH